MRGTLIDPGAPAMTRLGAYEIISRLAAGGMAELFLARITGPQGFVKLVVLKKVLSHLADTPRYARLLIDEAKLGACLDHPNIVQVHDVGIVDGHYFYAMEYVDGCDLRTVLRRVDSTRGMFPIHHAVMIARDLASALHYAHNRRGPDGSPLNIVHRDVSTSNIQLSYDGTVKLLDFGIAKSDSSSIRTRTGLLKGKAGYMSPEQARCAPIDHRTDVYSLGIVLWEMLTGKRLYDAPNELLASQLILNRIPTRPSEVRPQRDCPPELDAIVMRALAHPVEDRYQSARQFQTELEELARVHRLNQSSIALSEYMHSLFDTEIRTSAQHDVATVTRTDLHAAPQGTPPGRDDSTLWSFSEEPTRELTRESIDEEPTRSIRGMLTYLGRPQGPSTVVVHDDSITCMLTEEPTRPVVARSDPQPVLASRAEPLWHSHAIDLADRVYRAARTWARAQSQAQRFALLGVASLILMMLTVLVVRQMLSAPEPAIAPTPAAASAVAPASTEIPAKPTLETSEPTIVEPRKHDSKTRPRKKDR